MRKRLILGLSVLMLAACVQMPPKQAMAEGSVDEVLKMAEDKLAMAKAADAEWRAIDKATGGSAVDLTKLLEAAKEKAAAGETDEAIRIAKKVAKLSELGVEQAKDQKGAKPMYN